MEERILVLSIYLSDHQTQQQTSHWQGITACHFLALKKDKRGSNMNLKFENKLKVSSNPPQTVTY